MTTGPVTGNPAALADLGPVHIVGVGGAGMSGIARILLAQGVAVSGSDARDSRRLASLRALGAEVYVGHDGTRLGRLAYRAWIAW